MSLELQDESSVITDVNSVLTEVPEQLAAFKLRCVLPSLETTIPAPPEVPTSSSTSNVDSLQVILVALYGESVQFDGRLDQQESRFEDIETSMNLKLESFSTDVQTNAKETYPQG